MLKCLQSHKKIEKEEEVLVMEERMKEGKEYTYVGGR